MTHDYSYIIAGVKINWVKVFKMWLASDYKQIFMKMMAGISYDENEVDSKEFEKYVASLTEPIDWSDSKDTHRDLYEKAFDLYIDYTGDITEFLEDKYQLRAIMLTHDDDDERAFIVGYLLGNTEENNNVVKDENDTDVSLTDLITSVNSIADKLKVLESEDTVKIYLVKNDCSCCT